jgi:hypothetical protein
VPGRDRGSSVRENAGTRPPTSCRGNPSTPLVLASARSRTHASARPARPRAGEGGHDWQGHRDKNTLAEAYARRATIPASIGQIPDPPGGYGNDASRTLPGAPAPRRRVLAKTAFPLVLYLEQCLLQQLGKLRIGQFGRPH